MAKYEPLLQVILFRAPAGQAKVSTTYSAVIFPLTNPFLSLLPLLHVDSQ